MSNILRASAGAKDPVDIRGVPFGGVRPDKAPSHLSPTDFISLENVRRIGGLILNRPGQTSFAELSGEPTGMYDFQSGSFPGAGAGGGMLLTIGGGEGFDLTELSQYGTAMSPKRQIRTNTTTFPSSYMRAARVLIQGESNLPIVDCLVVAQNGTGATEAAIVHRLEAVDPGYNIDAINVGATLVTPMFSLPEVAGVIYTRIDTLIQYGEKLFICATDFAGTAWAVFSWTGQTIAFERALTGGLGSAAIEYQGKLIVFADTNMHILAQDETWSVVATGATAATTVNPNTVVVYRDVLYFAPSGLVDLGAGSASRGRNLFTFDGTTVTILLPATTGITTDAAKTRIFALAVFLENLYFTWAENFDANPVWNGGTFLGKFDGSTWNATYLTFGDTESTLCGVPLCAFQGSLYIGMAPGLQKSPGAGTASGWTSITLNGTSYQQNLEVH